ncbi:DUF418 domain-containing protein [Robertmurraya sp. FSL R5-0851]|uniref:DUF418 domain-containing protein n=1 Tax=Robertmurraya sp. FSL R5-0851 TaxID=2921584 RepID=UPI0030F5E636
MKERLLNLDAIRGLAITGILFVNIISFGWPELYDSNPSSYWTTPLEQYIHEILRIFIQSNFYPVFAMLFGISLTFVFKSAEKRGYNPYYIFSRRLFFLLVIGAAHAFLIWYGDILLVYAVLGFLLLLFYRLKPKNILIAAASIWTIPNLLYGFLLKLNKTELPTINNTDLIRLIINNYQSNFFNGFIQNIIDWSQLYTVSNIPFVIISIFPMFLFGLYFAKSQWITKISLHQYTNLRVYVLFTSGILGFTLKSLPMLNPNSFISHHFSEAFGGPLIGLFYVLLVLVLMRKTEINMTYFSNLGRMSMTNYLLQSIIGFILFKFFGLYGLIAPIKAISLGFGILIIQSIFSYFWLKKYSYGPVNVFGGSILIQTG